MPRHYKRPPITEAVVEIRFRRPINQAPLSRIRNRIQQDYPLNPQPILAVDIEVAENSATVKQEAQGFRLTASDGAAIVTLAPQSISTSRLAPYEGWEHFVAAVRKNWTEWKRVVGWMDIGRIGVRFINRIDIPKAHDEPIRLEDYLNFSPRMPHFDRESLTSFAINVTAPLGQAHWNLILNGSTAPSALVDSASFLIDVDLNRQFDMPNREEDLWACIDQVREHKNRVFEACITDRTRELFDR